MLIVGNWKMNYRDISLFNKISFINNKHEFVICPPYLYITDVLNHCNIVGAQNCFIYTDGAYTGEISATMLKDIGCKYVIVGHSERYEDDNIVSKKVSIVIQNNMIPIICVSKIEQIYTRIPDQYTNDTSKYIIAYEPIKSIGTGIIDLQESSEVINQIKKQLKCQVLYGGSVNDINCKEIILSTGCNGLLIGNASLCYKKWEAIFYNVCLI